MIMRRAFIGAVVMLTGCGGGDSSGPNTGGNGGGGGNVPPPPALSVASATVAVGGSIKREAWLKTQRIQPSWKSDNQNIAIVTAEGIVTGIAAGTTVIRATSGESTGSAEITVLALTFKDFVVGGRQACAQSDAGTWYCWGDNAVATLGRFAGAAEICASQRRECSTTPRTPTTLPAVSRLAISGGGTACGLSAQGDVSCWGRNDSHILGWNHVFERGAEVPEGLTPNEITGGYCLRKGQS